MKRLTYLLTSTLLYLTINAQNTIVCRMSPKEPNMVNIKWYSSKLIYKEGVNLYRRIEKSKNWIKVNSTPIKKGNYKISEGEYKQDPELHDYVQLLDNTTQPEGIALFAILLKSFKSDIFSYNMGIQYDDDMVERGKSYEYEVREIIGSSEIPIATSAPIEIKMHEALAPPKNIEAKIKQKKSSMRWEPEPMRYYAMNIYRYTSENKKEIKLNKDPIVISKTKNKEGTENYPEIFYMDENLKYKLTYYYTFAAIDFFGEESKRSAPIEVLIKDTEAPVAPENLSKKINGKSVKISWTKKEKEIDLAGYNIYRSMASDSNYVKLNSSLVLPSDSTYTDKAPYFKHYSYLISSIDKDGNEARSIPIFVDVFDDEAPKAPQNLKIKTDTGRLQLQWDANSENDLMGYLIYRTINKNTDNNYVLVSPEPITENSFTDKLSINAKNNFLYKIVAVDSSYNKSDYSSYATNRMIDVTAPSDPFIKQVTLNEQNETVIEWLPNTETDLMGYSIFRKNLNDTNAIFEKQNKTLLNRQLFKYTDRNTYDKQAYAYYITASDSSGNISGPSNIFRFQKNEVRATANASLSSLTGSYNEKKRSVYLEWNKSDKKLRSTLYRRANNEASLTPIAAIVSDNSYSDKSIKEGRTYYYQVRGYDTEGNVSYSEIIKINVESKKSK